MRKERRVSNNLLYVLPLCKFCILEGLEQGSCQPLNFFFKTSTPSINIDVTDSKALPIILPFQGAVYSRTFSQGAALSYAMLALRAEMQP